MQISERLATMTDVELKNLSTNAERLGQTGSGAQQAQAKTLLPLVTAEILARKSAKLAETKAAAATRPRKRTPAPAATEDLG